MAHLILRSRTRVLSLALVTFCVLFAPTLAHAQGGTTNDAAHAAPGTWSSGYRNGTFYVRDPSDVFRLYVQGRVHADFVDTFGPGVGSLPPDSALKDGFQLRRARLEVAGEFFELWQWQVGAEFGPSSVDNPGATNATRACSVDPKTAALTCTDRESAVEAPGVKPAPTDVFINFAPSPWVNLQIGQYYLPFSLENRISDNTTPFLERSMAVRGLGAPYTRDIGLMAWGESPDKTLNYAVGVFNGDGPNRPNADNRFDVSGRALVRPFAASRKDDLQFAHLGASARGGSRDASLVGYDVPALTTQNGYAFWKPTYRDSAGRLLHIIPSGSQWAVGADAYLPSSIVDVTGEIIYASDETREAVDAYQLSPFTERTGSLRGYAYYAEAGVWIVGDRDIVGHPGSGRPLHVDLKKPQKEARHGLQALARWEQLHMTYSGAGRSGALDAKTPNGDIDVQAVTFGVNYWATRHLRVSLNYGVYLFPDSAPVSASAKGGPVQTPAQRAVAPAQSLAKGVDDGARDSGHSVHEIMARVGVQF